jgi:predicted DNA-binding ribbon-helix-helix protein
MATKRETSKAASAIVKYSLTIAGHRTSVSLEKGFWDRLRPLAADRGLSVAAFVAEIDAGRGAANLSSAIRVFVLECALAQAREDAVDRAFSRVAARAG